jgi:hypothetical protein
MMSDETKRLEKIIPNILAQARIKLNLEGVDISHLELFSGDPSDKFWTTYVMSLVACLDFNNTTNSPHPWPGYRFLLSSLPN